MNIMQFAETAPQVSLESHLDRIALEANVLANLIETFKSTIPSFIAKLKDVRSFLSTDDSEQLQLSDSLTKKQKKAIEAARRLNYMNFGEKLIAVPEGFEGNLCEYTVLLSQITSSVNKRQMEIMNEYTTILSSFLTNKEDKISLKDHTNFFYAVKNERENFVKRLGHFTNKKAGVSKARFKTVMNRMAQVDELARLTTTLTDSHHRSNLKALNESVTHCVELLDMIVDGVKDGRITNISPNATMNISKGAYEIAKYVEFIGVIYFDVTVLLHAVDRLFDDIIADGKA